MDLYHVDLADAIRALRHNLEQAAQEGLDSPIAFLVEPVELSIQVAVTKDVNGKIGWSVLGVGASLDSATTQTLVLRMQPATRRPDGTLENLTISDGRPPADGVHDHIGPVTEHH